MTLLSRLENAEQGSRELDAAVEVAVRWEEARRVGLDPEHRAVWRALPDGGVTDVKIAYSSSKVTTDISEAVALVERVLPGWRIDLTITGSESWAYLYDRDPQHPHSKCIRSEDQATPALALCIALLKALEAKEPSA